MQQKAIAFFSIQGKEIRASKIVKIHRQRRESGESTCLVIYIDANSNRKMKTKVSPIMHDLIKNEAARS